MKVNQEMCIGCGMCAGVCPLVFRLNEDGKAETYQNADVDYENAILAKDGCPVSAISDEE